MQDELQTAVGALATELNRSVFLEAPGFVPLAASAHYGAVDQARIDALLDRTTSPELVAYYKKWHLDVATAPVHIPGNNSLGLLPRVVYPIRHNGKLLAFVWLINAEPPLTETDDAAVARASRAMGRVLFRRDKRIQQRADADERALRTLLLVEDGAEHEETLKETLRRHDSAPSDPIAVLVAGGMTVASTGQPVASDSLRSFATELGETSSGTIMIPAAWPSKLVALAPLDGGAAGTTQALARTVRAMAGHHDLRIAGLGLASPTHNVRALPTSYRHASYCALVAERLTPHEAFKAWEDLGLVRLFAEIPWTSDGVDTLIPGLSGLLGDARSPLPVTLWTYLQCGGDVQETIRRLSIHRGTFYYRLSKTEQTLGIRLSDGETRFALHAGLMLAKLAGLSNSL